MKVFVKLVSVLLVFLTVLSLCACSEETGTPSKPPVVTGPVASEGTGEVVIKTQYLPEKVENPEELPVLKWVCLTRYSYGGSIGTWTEDAMHEVNQMLAERNMPFRIQFVLLTTNQPGLNMDWLSTPEAQTALQDADLITATMNLEQMQTYLVPITAYAKGEASPSLENAVAHPYDWQAMIVDGEIYAIPAALGGYYSVGWEVDTDALKNYGLSVEDFSGAFWEMDNLFAEIYKKNGSMPFLLVDDSFARLSDDSVPTCYPGAIVSELTVEMHTVGSCFAIDYSGQTPRVVNYLELDSVKNWQAALLRYQEVGYATDDLEEIEIAYKVCVASSIHTYVDYAVYPDHPGDIVIEERVQIPLTKPLFQGLVGNTIVSGISAGTENMEEALKLLNLIAEDEDFRLHLFYGKEGRDYTIEDGYYSITKTDGACYSLSFISPLSYFCGLTTAPLTEYVNIGTDYYTPAADGKTKLETYRESLDNSVRCCTIAFDFTGLDAELTAMYNIMENYFPRFSSLTAEEYNQMLQELKDAGSETIQAQLQKQLDDWLTKNPDWNS